MFIQRRCNARVVQTEDRDASLSICSAEISQEEQIKQRMYKLKSTSIEMSVFYFQYNFLWFHSSSHSVNRAYLCQIIACD